MKRNTLAIIEDESGNRLKIVENYKSDWSKELVIHIESKVLSEEQVITSTSSRNKKTAKIVFKSPMEKQHWVDSVRSEGFNDFLEAKDYLQGKNSLYRISLPPYSRSGGSFKCSAKKDFYIIGKGRSYYGNPECWLKNPQETLNQVADVIDSYD